jgi:hypothetical protein
MFASGRNGESDTANFMSNNETTAQLEFPFVSRSFAVALCSTLAFGYRSFKTLFSRASLL